MYSLTALGARVNSWSRPAPVQAFLSGTEPSDQAQFAAPSETPRVGPEHGHTKILPPGQFKDVGSGVHSEPGKSA